jgi:hypothetical protein
MRLPSGSGNPAKIANPSLIEIFGGSTPKVRLAGD